MDPLKYLNASAKHPSTLELSGLFLMAQPTVEHKSKKKNTQPVNHTPTYSIRSRPRSRGRTFEWSRKIIRFGGASNSTKGKTYIRRREENVFRRTFVWTKIRTSSQRHDRKRRITDYPWRVGIGRVFVVQTFGSVRILLMTKLLHFLMIRKLIISLARSVRVYETSYSQ